MRLHGTPTRGAGGRVFLPQMTRIFYALTAFALPTLGFAPTNGLAGGHDPRSSASFLAPLAFGGTPSAEKTGQAPQQTPRYQLSSLRMP